jgi:hypothetical protein
LVGILSRLEEEYLFKICAFLKSRDYLPNSNTKNIANVITEGFMMGYLKSYVKQFLKLWFS